jgi:hypothetical protein
MARRLGLNLFSLHHTSVSKRERKRLRVRNRELEQRCGLGLWAAAEQGGCVRMCGETGIGGGGMRLRTAEKVRRTA